MADINYETKVPWDSTLADVGFADADNNSILKGLAMNALKVTSGAPAATAGYWLPGAIIQNVITGVLYVNTGTTASPVWSIIDTSSGGLPALPDGEFWVGNATDVATSVAMSGDATMDNTGAVEVASSSSTNFEVAGGVVNAGATLAAGFIPTVAASSALSGPGAIGLTSYQTRFTSTATGNALTLADGTKIGQLKKVSYVAEGAGGDTGVITPVNGEGFTTATLNAVGDYIVFMWNGANWLPIDYVGVTLA